MNVPEPTFVDFKASLKSFGDTLLAAHGVQPELIPSEQPEKNKTIEAISNDKDNALAILSRWRMQAQVSHKKTAETECDFLIKFISAICG